jgi:hypothetical protein
MVMSGFGACAEGKSRCLANDIVLDKEFQDFQMRSDIVSKMLSKRLEVSNSPHLLRVGSDGSVLL